MEEKWKTMTNEDLCLEYQQTNNNDLFEYFVTRNSGLIYSSLRVALRKALGDSDNVIQFGRIAMWNAMLNFDKNKEAKFSTYFYFWVLNQLRDYKCEASALNLPKHIFNNEREFREKHPEYFNDNLSLSMVVGQDEDTILEDFVPSEEDLEADLEAKATREELIAYANRLDGRAANCIIDYFGLRDGIHKTLQIIGNKYGVTRERIRQIISKGLKKIRVWYTKDHKQDKE